MSALLTGRSLNLNVVKEPMKNPLLVVITFALLLIVFFTGCNDRPQNVENAETSVIEAERDLEVAKAEANAEVRIYKQEMNNAIVENNRIIANFKEQISNEDGNTKAAYEEKIAEVEKLNHEMKQKLDNYNHTNRENWDSFKEDFSSNMKNLENSLDDFFTGRKTATN